jgi:hypothetical protein
LSPTLGAEKVGGSSNKNSGFGFQRGKCVSCQLSTERNLQQAFGGKAYAELHKARKFEKFLWWKKPVVIAFRYCGSFDFPGAESTSREESEVWREEELMHHPVHPESMGN